MLQMAAVLIEESELIPLFYSKSVHGTIVLEIPPHASHPESRHLPYDLQLFSSWDTSAQP